MFADITDIMEAVRIVREGQSLSSKDTVPFIDAIEIPKAWNKYVDEPLTEKESESLRRSVNRQSPYGDLEWQGRISKDFGLESTLRPRGRPGSGAEK